MEDVKEIRFNGKEPAIAYTDFTAIYLSWSLSGGEYETAKKHELSHIWLQHQLRLESFEKDNKNVDRLIWNIAADLEIAKYIYTDDDNANITKPRSLLAGGITTKHLKDFEGEYAEDFYKELLKNAKTIGVSFDASGNSFEKEGDKEQQESIPEIVKDAIKKALEEKKAQDNKKSKEQLHKAMRDFKPPKPSLASEIDKAFGRNKIKRVSSYRRPNRMESDFLMKGTASRKKLPKFTLYVDRSGSFDATKTSDATKKLCEVVKKYRGKISQDVIYFNNDLMTIDPINGGGSTNYLAVAQDIVKNGSELNIVITDDDGCIDFDFTINQKVLVIPVGCRTTEFAKKINATEVL